MQVRLLLGALAALPLALPAQGYAWVRSPVNGHEYALTAPMNWHLAEATAVAEDAHLATIRNASEQAWIESQFGTSQNMWIGLNDEAQAGTYVWTSGETSTYRNWCPGEPNSRAGENYIHMAAFPGQCFGEWNDSVANRNYFGLMERKPAVFDWNWETPQTAPDAQANPGSAYDPIRGVAVVTGGVFSLGATHEWDGRTWTTIPNGRFTLTIASLAFDGQGVIAVQGNQTYRWDGTTWSDLGVSNSPNTSYVRLAYDASRDRVVAFGGANFFSASNDTWEWDGSAWTLLSPANRPPARTGHAMTWDSRTGQIVMFGGRTVPQGVDLGDTWTFDGTDWTQSTSPTSPSARSQHSLTHVDGTGVSVLFGGTTGGATLQDFWIWDGEEWQAPIAPTGTPTPRFMHTAFCFPGLTGQEIVHIGGANAGTPVTTTQVLNSTRAFASIRPRGEGCTGTTSPQISAIGLPAMGKTLQIRLTDARPYTGCALMLGFSDNFFGLPLPFDLTSTGMPGCDLWTSIDTSIPLVSNPFGVGDVIIPIPETTGLQGVYINCQFLAGDPFGNQRGIVVTGGLEGVIGR